MVVEGVMWWRLTIFWDTVRIQRPVANNATATAAGATVAADNATAVADVLGLRHPMPQHFYLYLYPISVCITPFISSLQVF